MDEMPPKERSGLEKRNSRRKAGGCSENDHIFQPELLGS